MKKAVSIIMALLICATLFVACNPNSQVVGVWTADKMEFEGESLDFKEYAESLGVDLTMTMEFRDDDTITMNVFGTRSSGDYSVNGNEIKYTIEGEESVVAYENDTIILDDGENKVYFVREK